MSMETTRDSGVFLFIYIYIYTVKCQYSSTKQSIQKSCVYAMIILLSIQSSCSIAFHPFVSIIKCSIRVSNYICPQWSYSSSSPNLIFFFFSYSYFVFVNHYSSRLEILALLVSLEILLFSVLSRAWITLSPISFF